MIDGTPEIVHLVVHLHVHLVQVPAPLTEAAHMRRTLSLGGEMHYLWRAVDHEGEVLESFATKTRDR